ncbi:hypothetical protein GCM10007420_14610 [Glycocaulis albus]|uniref:Integrase n=2 Tax=Glycocaulis albus TaxID=1382801 RepID=A0ABQ1XQ10_9PROT|nr:hypothetical protein GCM10007420_14610 [Glycocaulis albus]
MPRYRVMNHHMKRRGKVWQLRKRVPLDVREEVGREWLEESLRTADVRLARQRRDARLRELEREWDLIRRVGNPSGIESLLADAEMERRAVERGMVTPAVPTLASRLEDQLDDAAGAWGRREGLIDTHGNGMAFDELRDRFVEETKEGERLGTQLEALGGNLPIALAGERWLAKARLTDGTKREYRRFFSTAQAKLPLPQQVTRTDARLFIQWLAEEGGEDGSGFSRKTVNNHRSALSALWSYLDLDTAIWSGIRFEPTKDALKRDVWTLEEIVRLLDAAKALPGEAGGKLPRVIRLALYTGARAKEIAGMQYDAESDWIVIPRDATKTDAGERELPCPDAIRDDVKAWVADPWSGQSVTNRFSELKKGLGFNGRAKVLHSFRHTLLSRLLELGVQLATAQKIAGHKPTGMTYGRYGSKTSVESLRDTVNSLAWDERLEEARKELARRADKARR